MKNVSSGDEIGAGRFADTAVVVYGPQGCGKTRNAAVIAAHLGKSRIVDDFQGSDVILDSNTVCLTNDEWFAQKGPLTGPGPYNGIIRIEVVMYADIARELKLDPPATKLPVFCKDCAHHILNKDFSTPHCAEPTVQKVDLVRGPVPQLCRTLRDNDQCGPRGKLFVAKSADSVPQVVERGGDSI